MPTEPTRPSLAGPAHLAMDAELRKREHPLAMAFNSARDMMLLAKVEPGVLFRIVSVNRPYLDTVRAAGFPLTAQDFEGRTFAEAIAPFGFAPEAVAQLRARYEQVIRTREKLEFDEVTVTSRDTFCGRTTITPILDETGACGHLLYSSQDVTARWRAEQALKESEEKFAKAFRASPDAMSVHERESGRYVDVNEGFLRLFGYQRAEVIGRTPLELGFWSDATVRQAFVDRLRRDGSVHGFPAELRLPSGERRWCELSAEQIEIDGVPHNVTVLHDVTVRLKAEIALRESEEKFARAFRASPDAISISDLATGRFLDVNEGYERLSGFTRAEIIGRTSAELGIWSDPADREKIVAELKRKGSVRDMQVRARTRGGELIPFLLSAETVEIGGRTCLILVSRDVTARLQAEQALRASEEKFAKAFRASPDAISISERETGRLLEVNEGFQRLSGYERAELIGRTAEELGLWATPGARQQMAAALGQSGSVRNLQMRVRNRRGDEGDFLISVEVVEIGGQSCLVIVARDISDRLRAEQSLRESEEMFAKAFRASAYSLTISDLETGRYVDVNQGFERLSGYTRAEVIGRTSTELNLWINPGDRAGLVRRLQAGGSVRGLELPFRRQDGTLAITLCNCEVIELAGRSCILNVLEDITERRQAEEQKAVLEAQLRQNQKLEALGTLAGGIAHDFNNILTAIIVNQELGLMDLDRPAEVRQRLVEIGLASTRAKELVRQILTFSRQQQHERLRQPLTPIIQEALGLVRASLPATIEISMELAADAPPVLADLTQVHQVVMNLCTNAAHAMRERGGRLTVRLAARVLDEAACRLLPGLRPGAYAQLTIADTGHGMDPVVQARIFEPFFTTKGPGEGTGLGLAVVHGIMRDYDGGIFVQSRPGEGSAFDLYFPAAEKTGAAGPRPEEEILSGRGESILVVDDEEPICVALGTMLPRIGYRVETFTDPERALARLRAAPAAFDLLLTDRTMPRLTGPQLVAAARELRPDLPVVMMSGDSSHESAEGSKAVLGCERVAKPMDIAAVTHAMQRALRRSAAT